MSPQERIELKELIREALAEFLAPEHIKTSPPPPATDFQRAKRMAIEDRERKQQKRRLREAQA